LTSKTERKVRRLCYTRRSVMSTVEGLKALKPSHLKALVNWLKAIAPLPVREQRRRAGLLEKALREHMRADRPEAWGRLLQLSSKKKAAKTHATPDKTPH
jgi:hypothetical protein